MAQRARLGVATMLLLLTAGCTDLPETGVVWQANDMPLVVFKECDSPKQRLGNVTVYDGDVVAWTARIVDKSRALRDIPLAPEVAGYDVMDRLSGRLERNTKYTVEAKSVDGSNMGGIAFRPRDLRYDSALLNRREDGERYRPWPAWGRCPSAGRDPTVDK